MAEAKTPKGAEVVDAEDLTKIDAEYVTTFEEDDDPLSHAGDFLDEDGDGVDDKEQS